MSGAFLLRLSFLWNAPLNPTRQRAKEWIDKELSNPEYANQQPSIFERFFNWIQDHLFGHLPRVSSDPTASNALWIVAVALLLALIGFALWRMGPARRVASANAQKAAQFGSDPSATSAQMIKQARSAVASEPRLAAIWAFRALARSLVERTVLATETGLTAQDVSSAVAQNFGGSRFDSSLIDPATATFNRAAYSQEKVTQADAQQVIRTFEEVRDARPQRLPQAEQPHAQSQGTIQPSLAVTGAGAWAGATSASHTTADTQTRAPFDGNPS